MCRVMEASTSRNMLDIREDTKEKGQKTVRKRNKVEEEEEEEVKLAQSKKEKKWSLGRDS